MKMLDLLGCALLWAITRQCPVCLALHGKRTPIDSFDELVIHLYEHEAEDARLEETLKACCRSRCPGGG